MTLLGNACYLFGGDQLDSDDEFDEEEDGDDVQILDEVHQLNLLTYEWTLLPYVKYGYYTHSASAIDKKIYLFGGKNLLD